MANKKEIMKNIMFVSEKIYQVDNLEELWEESMSIKEIRDFDYIVECDTATLYKVKQEGA